MLVIHVWEYYLYFMALYCECISTYCVTYMKSVCQNGLKLPLVYICPLLHLTMSICSLSTSKCYPCVCVHVCGFGGVVAVVGFLKLLVCNLKHVHYLKSSDNNLDNISFLKKSITFLIIPSMLSGYLCVIIHVIYLISHASHCMRSLKYSDYYYIE